jgi:acyl-coenzyme A synthetase/AMP-(fatty) acid ligase
LTESDLIAHCRTMIGGYKVPRQVIFSADPLPRSGTGKILKPLLRQIYANAGN